MAEMTEGERRAESYWITHSGVWQGEVTGPVAKRIYLAGYWAGLDAAIETISEKQEAENE